MVRLRMLTLLLSLGLLLVASSASSQETIEITTRSVTFAWEAASGDVDFYDVYVERSGERIPHPEMRTPDATPSVEIDLEMGEVIQVSVVAGNYAGARSEESPWSERVRRVLPDVLELGVFTAHGSGSTPGDVFYDDPETGDVWVVKGDDPEAEPVHIGNEAPDSDWEVVATGDFGGDGDADLFWRNAADGATRIWAMDGVEYDEFNTGGRDEPNRGVALGTDWTPLMAGDFDGDGQDDLFWRNHEGQTLVWTFNFSFVKYFGNILIDEQYFPSVPDEDWQLLATGNFDGDPGGKDEMFWRDSRKGRTALWFCEFTPGSDDLLVLDYVQYEGSDDLPREWDVVEVIGNDEDLTEGLLMRSDRPPYTDEWWR